MKPVKLLVPILNSCKIQQYVKIHGSNIQICRYSTKSDRTYSTAFGLSPEYYEELYDAPLVFGQSDVTQTAPAIKDYSAIPGPKELPLIGNAWRFAPIIGN